MKQGNMKIFIDNVEFAGNKAEIKLFTHLPNDYINTVCRLY